MERRNPHAFARFADQLFNALLHLARRFVRKGDCQNVVRVHQLFIDQVCDAVCEYAGFSAARARHDEQRAFRRPHRFLLFFVQIVQPFDLTHFYVPLLFHCKHGVKRRTDVFVYDVADDNAVGILFHFFRLFV